MENKNVRNVFMNDYQEHLKNCPFCGGGLMVKSTELQSNVSVCEIRHVNPGKAFMDMCPMEIRYFKSKKDAVASANMRNNQG